MRLIVSAAVPIRKHRWMILEARKMSPHDYKHRIVKSDTMDVGIYDLMGGAAGSGAFDGWSSRVWGLHTAVHIFRIFDPTTEDDIGHVWKVYHERRPKITVCVGNADFRHLWDKLWGYAHAVSKHGLMSVYH